MATPRQQSRTAFLSNISIRRKILIAFAIIAAMLLLQSLVSLNSVDSLSSDFEALQTQETIRARAIAIDTLQAKEGELLTRWFISEDIVNTRNRELFNSTAIITENEYDRIQYNISRLESLDTSVDINLTGASDILALLLSTRTDYRDTVNRFFSSPGLMVLNGIKHAAHQVSLVYRNASSYLGEYILTNDPAYAPLFDVELSNNYIGEFADRVQNLRQAYRVLANPQERLQAIGIGQNINTSLFDEMENLNNIELSIQLQTADALVNGIAATMETIDDIRTIPQNEYDELVTDYSDLQDTIYNIEKIMQKFLTIVAREEAQIKAIKNKLNGQITTMSDDITQLRLWAISGTAQLNSNFGGTVAYHRYIQIIVVVFALVLVIIMTNILTRLIANPIQGVVQWSDYIANGDLSKTKRIRDREDEIGRLEKGFKQMNLNLREIIAQVQKSANVIADTSEDLASNTEEINATAEEVSAIAQTMAKGSTEQAEIITSIVQELQKSSQVVENVVTQITDNLAIIRDLSEQTNILALNTAIEAANAGEFGKGFTVIAENIRKMSDQTRRTSQRVSLTSQEILQDLQASFGQIAEMIENVASVSEETAASAEEVAASAEEMTASMESIASNSSLLNEQSSESLNVIKQFKLD